MSPRESRLYADAGKIAMLAMGRTEKNGPGRPRTKRGWAADEDPLAYVCLVEWIVGVARRYARTPLDQEAA